MLRFLARFLAVIGAILFVLTAVPAIFLHSAGTRVALAATYQQALAAEGIYARLPAFASDLVAHIPASPNQATQSSLDLLRQLTPADWDTLSGTVLPASYLQAQTESALDQFCGWLHSSEPTPTVKVGFAEVKRRLVAPETEAAYVRFLEGRPPCTDQQYQSGGDLPLACRPPAAQMAQVRDGFRRAMQSAAEGIPDTLDLFAQPLTRDQSGNLRRGLTLLREKLNYLEWLAVWGPVVPAALLLLVALFGVRSFRGLLLWWGIPCLLAGGATVLFALPTAPAANWMFTHVIVPQLPKEIPAATLAAVVGLVTAVVQQLLGAALKVGAVLALGGLGAVIVSPFFKAKPQPVAAT